MKLYTFVHTMLKPTHQGVQGMHALATLAMRCGGDITALLQFNNWAQNHQTIVMKDGGISASMVRIRSILARSELPWASFYEDIDTLQQIETAIAVVIPTHIWIVADYFRNYQHASVDQLILTAYKGKSVEIDPKSLTPLEWEIVEMCNSCKLA